MSGTEDEIFAAQNSQENQNEQQNGQPGAAKHEQNGEKALSSSEKMNQLIREAALPKHIKREMEKLRKEAAKFRSSSKEEATQKQVLLQKTEEIQHELETLRCEHRNLKIMRKLDSAGCIKSDLVAKDVPADCEDLDKFIAEYKEQNGFLFNVQKKSYGGTFKPSTTTNLTPSQKMDQCIRAALGR